MHMS